MSVEPSTLETRPLQPDPDGGVDARMVGRRLRPWEVALSAALFAWVFLLGCTPLHNMDIWTHLRTGELIWERGQVPLFDWYTYTNWDRPWIESHWLFQLLMHALYQLGGVDLLILVKAACLLATVVIAWNASGRDLPTWTKTACWIPPIVCLACRSIVRPDMLSLLFLALWLWITPQLSRRPWLVWGLPLIQLIWTNCHSLFILGPIVGGAYFVDRLVRQMARGRYGIEAAPQVPRLATLVLAGASTLVVSFVNPYFEEGALFPLVVYENLAADPSGEHLPLIDFLREDGFANVTNIYLVTQLGLWLVTASSFILLLWKRQVNVMGLLLFLAFSHLGLMALRNITLFGLVAGVLLCENVSRLQALRRTGVLQDEESSSGNVVGVMPLRMTQLLLGVVSVSVFFVVTNHPWSVNGSASRFGLGEKKAWYAHEAAQFAALPGLPNRAFVAEFGQAAVYIFHNGPEHKVFMDGRLEVVTPETEAAYHTVLHAIAEGRPGWENLVRDSQGTLPVMILDSRFARPAINGMIENPQWQLVFADSTAAVFTERSLAVRLGLPPADFAPLLDPPM